MNLYQEVIHLSRYARYRPELGRRETWDETVERYISFFKEHITSNFSKHKAGQIPWKVLHDAILEMEIMPSMRCLMTAGKALERDNVAGYNCSYLPVDSIKSFDEAMYILMCGTGVGFSVERQYIQKLPEVPDDIYKSDTTIVVQDSKIGWATGLREFISLLYQGKLANWDTSRVRPAGSPLRTFGGRASGPEPLEDLFRFSARLFTNAAGRKLTSIECHDLMCKIGEVVVVGGVRRSALISLSNLTDERMRHAKSGEWWISNPQRALANNSVAYTEKPDIGIFMREWESLYESKSGERGVFNRVAAQSQASRSERRIAGVDYGTNPCSEIILRPNQFCNLSEVIVRPDDSTRTISRKCELATILGTIQSTLTDFRYLSKKWKDNTEEERLLGVSLTGIRDHDTLGNYREDGNIQSNLREYRDLCVRTNVTFADTLGIQRSCGITCVKPSGTVSQLVNAGSGIHPRYSRHYIRRVRFDNKDPMAQFLVDKGVPVEQDYMNPNAMVFSFPIKSPDTSILRDQVDAIEQLNLWKMYQDHWCEHKPSCTIYVREHEWMEVGAWVYRNFDAISGVSFLPYDNGTYRQAPYEEIDEATFNQMEDKMPKSIDWTEMKEGSDQTSGSQELACTAGVCEL